MITVRRASQKDQVAWDEYVNKHPAHSPYHLFAWKNAVADAYQHGDYYLIAEQQLETAKQIVGILPLIIFKKPFSKPSLCALPFCDVGGVLADDESITQLLLAESQQVANNLSASCLELRMSGSNESTAEQETNDNSTGQSTEKVSMLMTLPNNSEELFASFKSKLRSQIRKADKNGLHYTIGSEPHMLDDFYQVFSHNMRALGSPVHAKQWFQALLKHYQQQMIISLVYKDDVPIGGGIVLVADKKAAIPWASTKAEFNRLSPNMMLYWSLLKHLSEQDITDFDFGRSSYGEGTFKFKQQWGAQPQPLNWQVIDFKNPTEKNEQAGATSSKLRTHVENVWRKLPIGLTVFVGPKIRKYISL